MRFAKASAMVAATVLVVLGVGATLSAGTDDNSNRPVLEAFKKLEIKIDSLVTSVSALSAATVTGNTRFTGPVVVFPADNVTCTASNVAAVGRTVKAELINANTGVLIAVNGTPGVLLQPGTSTAAATAPATGTRVICKFTVVDGVKADIRGTAAVYGGSTASDKLVIAAE